MELVKCTETVSFWLIELPIASCVGYDSFYCIMIKILYIIAIEQSLLCM